MPSDSTPNLALPYIAPSQAQKHVTHNEAIRTLDAIVQLTVLDHDLSMPPASPSDGDRYVVPTGASGVWSGRAGAVAAWQDGIWNFYLPQEGWLAWVADQGRLYAFHAGTWSAAPAAANPVPLIGVNTTADATNRLAVKSDAALFDHDDVTPGTGDIRVKLNKSLTAKTASFQFQTGYSGRAEIGTAGDDNLHVKTSPDGSTWYDAIIIGGTGAATFQPMAINVTSAATEGILAYRVGGNTRWRVGTKNAETGGNTGSDYHIHGYTDAGAYLNTPITITRANGGVALPFAAFTTSGMSFYNPPRPATDNAYSLGSSGLRWSVVYAATGTVNTSDERLKTDIEDCPLGLAFIRALSPKLYRWREGGTDVTFEDVWEVDGKLADAETLGATKATIGRPIESVRPGRRLHAGLLSQDVKAALNAAGVDCGMWVLDDKTDPQSTQSLRYDQLIAPLIQAVKELAVRVEMLTASEPQ